MHLRGQTTTVQTRLEKSRACRCWSERHPHCSEGWLLRLDGSQMATTMAKARARRLHLTDGSSSHWPDEYLSRRITGDDPSPAPAPSRLSTSHTVSGTQDGCLLVRPAAPESSMHSQAPQTPGLDAPLSTASRPTPTTAWLTGSSASRMADGRGAGSCEERGWARSV